MSPARGDPAASLRARLAKLARERGAEFQLVLSEFAIERRATLLPSARPLVLKPAFLAAPERQTQWRAFLRRGRLDAQPDTAALADALNAFLGPPLRAVAQGEPFAAQWPAGGSWQPGTATRPGPEGG